MTQSVISALGVRRFAGYLTSCNNDYESAMTLYEWDLRMSGAMYEAIHMIEIGLRNSVDRELRVWNLRYGGSADWLLQPHFYLKAIINAQGNLDTARERAKRAVGRVRAPLHDDVLAQMTFGSWRYILPSASSVPKQKLWDEAVVRAFPNWHGDGHSLATMVDSIYKFRNRIAHLEPIHRVDLRAKRRQILNLAKALDSEFGQWCRGQERMLVVVESRPDPVSG